MGVGVDVDLVAHPRSVPLKHQKTQQKTQQNTQQKKAQRPPQQQQSHQQQRRRQHVGVDVGLVAHRSRMLHAHQHSRRAQA